MEDDFDAAEKELKENDLVLEDDEAIEIKCDFDATALKRKSLVANAEASKPSLPKSESKPKFKPRDLVVPK